MSLALGIAGRNLLPYRSGYGAQVIAANHPNPFGIPGGATIDWNLFSALGSNLTLPDTELMLAGWRYARYGQVFCRVTTGAANLLTISGSPTGGTFTITAASSINPTQGGVSGSQVSAAIPYNATAAQVRSALEALENVGVGNVVVTGANGGPYYITPASTLGTMTFSTTGSLTGGSTPAATFSTGAGGIARSFGPFDPSASDGRQTLVRDNCFILNRTRVMGGSLQLPLQDDMHTGECITKGLVWGAKVIATTGTHTLAAGPTWTELLAAMPQLETVYV